MLCIYLIFCTQNECEDKNYNCFGRKSQEWHKSVHNCKAYNLKGTEHFTEGQQFTIKDTLSGCIYLMLECLNGAFDNEWGDLYGASTLN